ncbi:MAG: hypothetical protein KJO66_09335 [Gammaproteobacteria bacterium]|nr:hypothetical protein [Gammaproteobacteria bacterium]NNJ93764.1 hypothetical protein [Halobacteria archaeon]
MVFEIASIPGEPRRLTQTVLQITAMLDLYQAELARVLGIQCGDIGQLASGRQCLQPDSNAWDRATQFVHFYQLLFRRMAGDGVAMRHWLRIEDRQLEAVPHRLIVDEDRLGDVVACLERASGWSN